jgi:hypothetical protein
MPEARHSGWQASDFKLELSRSLELQVDSEPELAGGLGPHVPSSDLPGRAEQPPAYRDRLPVGPPQHAPGALHRELSSTRP